MAFVLGFGVEVAEVGGDDWLADCSGEVTTTVLIPVVTEGGPPMIELAVSNAALESELLVDVGLRAGVEPAVELVVELGVDVRSELVELGEIVVEVTG